MLLIKVISVFCVFQCAYSAKILGVFPLDWGSHYILGTKLMKSLAEAGHDVTLISPHKYKNPPENGSWTDVVLEEFGEKFEETLKEANFFEDNQKSLIEKIKSRTKMLITMSNKTLQHPHVKKLMSSDATFDVVIVEQLLNDCHHVFAYHFNCPLILLSSIGPNSMVNPKVGNPSPVSTVPNYNFNDRSKELTFIWRLKNLFQNIIGDLMIEFDLLPQHNNILHELFPGVPDIKDLYYNVSLVLLNSHSSMTDAVPLVPNMVEIGGYFIDPPQKLPKDLHDFLDSAKDGAIYFSMGSSLKSKDMPEEKKKALLDVFKKLKQKVLWKFEEDLVGKSDNIFIKNWMPQQDILAHPNIKLFITHGGLLSTTEAIYHGVPVLTIPVFGDQEMNAGVAESNGYGLKISYHDANFNEETLNNLIQELINNPKYRENAQGRSKIYHDRPLTSKESAVYWVEYVIRHKGAPHLRVAGVGMPWYKYFMIDVIVVLIISVWLVVCSIKYVIRRLLSGFISKTKLKTVKQKKN